MLIGELTNLRAVDRSDAAAIQAWLDDPELMRWWGVGAPAISLTSVMHRIERWLEDERTYGHPTAFVIENVQGESVGMLELSNIQPIDRSAELSLFLTDNQRGNGLGSDAIATIADAAFEQWNLHRLAARSEGDNSPAHRFFERNGFRLEGRLREARYLDGAWSDILIFGRIRARVVDQ